ncbi:MAG: ABC transporter substrate-binding protein [Micromonosporaceae bacterium]
MIATFKNGTPGRQARSPLALVAAMTLPLALAACSDSGPGPSAESGIDYDSLSVDELYEGAKEEGKVVVNNGASPEEMEVIAEKFHELYPGIEIEHFEQQGEDSAAKLLAEANAGVYETDLLDTEQNSAYAIAQEGLLAEYAPPVAENFDDRLKQPWFTGHRIQIKAITYNTEKVSEADAPDDYQDLLDPKWKGRLCVEESEVSTFADMLQDMGREEGIAYWKDLHETNEIQFIKGQGAVVESVIAGECHVSVAANVHSTSQAIEEGAPIKWVKTDPLYANFGAVGVVKNAPHPYAARLWVNYLLSDDGQQSVANDWRIPANQEVQPKQPDLQQGTYNMVLAGEEVMKNFSEYNSLFYETTGRPVVG